MSIDREKLTGLKESFWKEPVIEAKVDKKELAAATERTKHAMSFLRKIHKAVEAGSLESVLDAIEKAATKGDIDDKQETRLKDACKRRKEALANSPKETEPTEAEEKGVEATEVKEAKYGAGDVRQINSQEELTAWFGGDSFHFGSNIFNKYHVHAGMNLYAVNLPDDDVEALVVVPPEGKGVPFAFDKQDQRLPQEDLNLVMAAIGIQVPGFNA